MACTFCRKGMPPLTEQAKSLLSAASGSIKAWVNGQPVFSYADLRMKRLMICKVCPEFDSGIGRCRKCGCYIRAKTALAQEKCPLGKW